MRRFLSLVLLVCAALAGWAQWTADTLGMPLEMMRIDQDRDYSGPVRCTLLRKLADEPTHQAALYVHGYNDYYFQQELADSITAHGMDFYALDLRKYGRSILPGNTPFEARDLKEYFADIDTALAVIAAGGSISSVALIGHSTGGLITAYYMASPGRSPLVKCLVLNSPFLAWNVGKAKAAIPLVSALGKPFPKIKIKQSMSTAYAESLLAEHHGEWSYDTNLKLTQSPPVQAGWIRAIDKAQKYLRKHKETIDAPILLMTSTASVNGSEWTEEHNRADAVLNVDDLIKYGSGLGPDVTIHQVAGGLHDLILSAPDVRAPLYTYMLNWIEAQMR